MLILNQNDEISSNSSENQDPNENTQDTNINVSESEKNNELEKEVSAEVDQDISTKENNELEKEVSAEVDQDISTKENNELEKEVSAEVDQDISTKENNELEKEVVIDEVLSSDTLEDENLQVNKTEEIIHEAQNITEIKEEETVSLSDFSWERYEDGSKKYSDDEYTKLVEMYNETFSAIDKDPVIQGKIIAQTDRDFIIDIGAKSEGVISINEFRYNPDFKVGDMVEVIIDQKENKTGQLVLSHKKARAREAWDKVQKAHKDQSVVAGYVKCRTKGGMIVEVYGLESFLPGSQIDVKPIRDYDVYVGKNMEFKVVKINNEFKNIVVSHKALIEEDIEQQKKDIISKLDKGQVLEGVVKNITSYGVFVDLGGVDGLIHITDLSWSRIQHPNEVVELDQQIKVVTLDFDENKTRIQLGLKQLTDHPWDSLDEKLKVGDKVKANVVVLADYGAFVELMPGVEALIHVSEMSWSTHLRSAQDFLELGQEIEAQVLTLDRDERKMSLGIKQLYPDPWIEIQKKYVVDSKHKGIVKNFTNFGIFLELEEGIDGLIHISDLSWTKKVKHPADFTKVGEQLEVIVLEVDTENRRLSLGHKQLQDNPWDIYETIFTEESVHEGEVVSLFDKGGTVLFKKEGLEGYIPKRYCMKADKSKLEEGEVSEFKVLEFSKENRRIIVCLKDNIIDFEEEEKKNKKKEEANKNKAMKNVQSKINKATLGDLNALSDLKNKIDE